MSGVTLQDRHGMRAPSLSRRWILGGIASGAAALALPRLAWTRVAGERRFVFIIQRGAADGLATLAPVGDPAYAGLRGRLAEEFSGLPQLDGFFALHPSLGEIGKLYDAREALFFHAAASGYRERSHFDAQNVLETGGDAPYRLKDGWLNRVLGLLPSADARGLALAPTVPAVLRGGNEVASYAESRLPQPADDLLERVGQLYAADPQLHPLWQTALQTRAMAMDSDPANAEARGGARTGALAASLMTGPQGARVMVIETGGWDTHAQQQRQLGVRLRDLDALIGALRSGLGPAWGQTAVLIATEFGRTAAVNGTGGTDHGTASAAMLLGGAVAGGRIIADWPGLAAGQLYEGRDLRPSQSLEAVMAGAIAAHFGLDPALVRRTAFPASTAPPLSGLIRT